MWMNCGFEFGKGKYTRWQPIYVYANFLGEEICGAILFLYAFTGFDAVSQFQRRVKRTA